MTAKYENSLSKIVNVQSQKYNYFKFVFSKNTPNCKYYIYVYIPDKVFYMYS